jgi:hypothetical protein
MLFGKKFKIYSALITLISFTSTTALAVIPTTTSETETAAVESPAYEQVDNRGKFLELRKGEPVPFSKAWCFDEVATAKILAMSQIAEKKCNLEISQALEKQSLASKLELSNLQVRLATTEKQMEEIIRIKNEEIAGLEQAALKRPNDYNLWWATGGFAAGVLVTVATIFAVR